MKKISKPQTLSELIDEKFSTMYNADAETCVIGSVILENDSIEEITDLVPSDFHLQNNAYLFQLFQDLHSKRKAIDLVTLKHELTRRSKLDEVGGLAYLDTAIQAVPTARNIQHYARIVRDFSVKRQIFSYAFETQKSAVNGLDPEALLSVTAERFDAIKHQISKSKANPQAPVIFSAQEFLERPIMPRDFIIDSVLPSKSLAMVYGYRGRGKTFFLLSLALAVTTGRRFLCWSVRQARRVLYIDGEMSLDDLHQRIKAIAETELPDNFHILASEDFYRQHGRYLNFNLLTDQQWLRSILEQMKAAGKEVELIIFDNLSSLTSSAEPNSENINDDDPFLIWVRQLRHEGLTPLFAHHSGKNQEQRGKSKREDFLDLSINLAEPSTPAVDGATFRLEFAKVRGKMPKPAALECELIADDSGCLFFTFGDAVAQLDDVSSCLLYIAEHQPQMQMEIVEALKISKFKVTRAVQKARKTGLLNGLDLTEKGSQFVQKQAAIRCQE